MSANPASLPDQFRMARHVFLVAAPVGALVGMAIAAYDYVVNVLLWERFTHEFPPLILCLVPIAGMFLTGLVLSVFRVPSSSMADEVVKAYHKPEIGIEFETAIPKLIASWQPWVSGPARAWKVPASGWAAQSAHSSKPA